MNKLVMAWNQKSEYCHQAQIVVWFDLNPDQCQELNNAPTLKNVKDILARIFNLSNYAKLHKEKILLNLYTYTVQFAREEGFSIEQLSAYFSIVKLVHEVAIKSPFGNMDETFTYFKDLLMSHCVCRPPNSTELFSIKEARKIAYHVVDTYFRHFKLYKYAFTPQVQLDLVLNYIGESDSITTLEVASDSEEEKREKSEIADLRASDDGSDKKKELANISEKEEAKKYLRKLITDFLQEKIEELKLAVTANLEQSARMVNFKLDEAGYHDTFKKTKKYGKCGKRVAHN